MIIAGEASGDHHGARLVNAMEMEKNNLVFCGIGGKSMKKAGVKILVDAAELSVVGITEVFAKFPTIFKALAVAKRLLKSLNPDLLILIDYPDFNLRVAVAAKKMRIPVLYYISPQIWAWRQGRVKKIGKIIDHMAVILPFEEIFYTEHDIPVTFVGHPLLDSSKTFCKVEKSGQQIIGLLPGSRNSEITKLLPVMLESAVLLQENFGDIKFILSVAPTVNKQYVEEATEKFSSIINLELNAGPVVKVLEQSRLVITASGTVTLETAIAGIPMIIVYKVSPVSFMLGKLMIKVDNIGLVNLIAGKTLVPELIQNEASPQNITATACRMLNDPILMEDIRNELLKIKNILGGPGASLEVAKIALNMLS
ncbi:lipid-A-disaccharide synthase [Desulfosarcina sp. BuS5]|uniref:lipid-A-disaccharide synthase n=1 Tax=Desulfosarcina sp. BuS5 TaxID=933262 RepID=UPI0018DE5374|nr:lipid-A-disaccharide synthase [Desulfosarcina sp. BuS5]